MTIAKWAGIALAFGLATGSMPALTDCDWQKLGEREVSYKTDRDQITLDSNDESYSRVQLRVKNAPVEFNRVTVHFGNGTQQVLEMRDEIDSGGRTRDIDLQGSHEERRITRVDFNYKTEERDGPRAVVELWGMS